MTWSKGQSGHPGGRAKNKLYRDALLMAVKEAGEDMPALREGMRAIVEKAQQGDLACHQFVRDTLDGRPAQVIEQDQPFQIEHKLIRYEVVYPSIHDGRRDLTSEDRAGLPAPIGGSEIQGSVGRKG